MELFDLACRLGAWCSAWCLGPSPSRCGLLDERVGEDQEYPHHRCKGDLRRFPVGHESRVVSREVGIAPDRDAGRHVEQSAHVVPASLNEAASPPGAGLLGHRGQAGGTGPGQGAEFRHVDD